MLAKQNAGQVQRSGQRRWALAAVTGLLLTLTYPPFDGEILAWGALAPLLIAIRGARPPTAFLLGWFAGAIGSLAVTGFWIFSAVHAYFHWSPLATALFTVAITQLFAGVYFGLFALGGTLVGMRLGWLLTPSLFVTTEYARAHLFFGCPWELLGHSQTSPALIQICDLTGVYGLSFLLALTATAIADLPRTMVTAAVAAGALLLALGYGQRNLARQPTANGAALDVLVIQANLPNDERGRPDLFADHLRRYLDLTQSATGAPDLVIWPENGIGFFPEENPPLVRRITDYLGTHQTALLTGAPRAGKRTNAAAIYNSAYLFTAGGVRGVYDKRKLLPLVERWPLRADDGPYVAGSTPTIFSLAGRRFATLICFEAIYPHLARQLVAGGGQLLINISNDSWFEVGAGPEQHYQVARFRAVENRVSFVRVTNSGVSGVIDPWGREIARLPRGGPFVQSVTVPIGPGGSFYSRHGDLFAALCALLSFGAVLLSRAGAFPPPGGQRSPRTGRSAPVTSTAG